MRLLRVQEAKTGGGGGVLKRLTSVCEARVSGEAITGSSSKAQLPSGRDGVAASIDKEGASEFKNIYSHCNSQDSNPSQSICSLLIADILSA